MEAPIQDFVAWLESDEALTEDQFEELLDTVRNSELNGIRFKGILDKLLSNKSALSRNAVKAAKVAQGLYALRQYRAALEWFEKAGASKTICYLKACSQQSLGEYDSAIAGFEQAEAKGCDPFNITMAVVDCLRRAGRLEEAQEKLKRASRVGDIRAEYHHQVGQLHEANGQHEPAMAEFEKAVELDNCHVRALFALAYAHDLYGNESQAIEYYQMCVECSPCHVNALLNLAVLYEDNEDWFAARQCVKKVLDAYPNHARARMFLKDIESSMVMYIDEEQERRIDKRNQVLEIPISDFELSVRSRNCLKKMNIRLLGDLLKVSETELLAYKNFGETSLHEIKIILNSKGLRLGQSLEEPAHSILEDEDAEEADTSEVHDEILSAPVTELELSVRARKCFQQLNIQCIGDLTKHTEAELLGCKNFGMTSLVEIKQRLKERGLSLRQLD